MGWQFWTRCTYHHGVWNGNRECDSLRPRNLGLISIWSRKARTLRQALLPCIVLDNLVDGTHFTFSCIFDLTPRSHK